MSQSSFENSMDEELAHLEEMRLVLEDSFVDNDSEINVNAAMLHAARAFGRHKHEETPTAPEHHGLDAVMLRAANAFGIHKHDEITPEHHGSDAAMLRAAKAFGRHKHEEIPQEHHGLDAAMLRAANAFGRHKHEEITQEHHGSDAAMLRAANAFGRHKHEETPPSPGHHGLDKFRAVANGQRGKVSLAGSGSSKGESAGGGGAGMRRFSLAPLAMQNFAHSHGHSDDKKVGPVHFSDALPKNKNDEADMLKKKHIDDAHHKLKGMAGIIHMRAVMGHASKDTDSEHEDETSIHGSASTNSEGQGDVLMDFPTNLEEILELKEKKREGRGQRDEDDEPLEIFVEADQRKPWMKLIMDLDEAKDSDDDNDGSYLPYRGNRHIGKYSAEEQMYMIGFDFENNEYHGIRHSKAESVDSERSDDTGLTELKHAQQALGWLYADVRSQTSESLKGETQDLDSRPQSPLQPYTQEIISSDQAGSSQKLATEEKISLTRSLTSSDSLATGAKASHWKRAISALSKPGVLPSGRSLSLQIAPNLNGSKESPVFIGRSQRRSSAVPSSPSAKQDISLDAAPPDLEPDGNSQNLADILSPETGDVRAQVATRIFGAGLAKLAKKAEEKRVTAVAPQSPITAGESAESNDTAGGSDIVKQKKAIARIQSLRRERSVEITTEKPPDPEHPELDGMTELFEAAKTEEEKRQARRKQRREERQGRRQNRERGDRSGSRDRRRHRHHGEGNESAAEQGESGERRHRHRHRRRHRHRVDGEEGGDDNGENRHRGRSRRHRRRSKSRGEDDEKNRDGSRRHHHRIRAKGEHKDGDEKSDERRRQHQQSLSRGEVEVVDENQTGAGHNHRSQGRDREDEGTSWNNEEKQKEGPVESTEAFSNASKTEVMNAFRHQDGERLKNANVQDRKESKSQSTTNTHQGKGTDSAPTKRLSDQGKPIQTSSKIGKVRSKLDKENKPASRRTSLGGNSIAVGDEEESFYGIFDRDDEDAENGVKSAVSKEKSNSSPFSLLWAKKWYLLGAFTIFLILVIAVPLGSKGKGGVAPTPFSFYEEAQAFSGVSGNTFTGSSVSISADGTFVAVGYLQGSGSETDSGVVRIFELNADEWLQLGPTIEGIAIGDEFGGALSLADNGQRLAVGAENSESGFGQTKVFEYDEASSSWRQLGMSIPGFETNGSAGTTVAISGNGERIAVGDPRASSDTGYVAIYEQSGVSWVQIGETLTGRSSGDFFGNSISLSLDGDILAIGSQKATISGRTRSGNVSVYRLNASRLWDLMGNDISGPNAGDQFGISVALSSDGSRVAIGANGHDNTSGVKNAGACRVFSFAESGWTQIGDTLEGQSDREQSGLSIALSRDGSLLACGGPNSSMDATNSGVVRVYRNIEDNGWEQVGDNLVGTENSAFGSSIALSQHGEYLAVGAPTEVLGGLENVGVARIFRGA